MINTAVYEQTLFETIKRGATEISADVKEAFEAAIARESNPNAKKGLLATLNSMEMSAKRENPLCVDTGCVGVEGAVDIIADFVEKHEAWKK